MYKYTLTYVLIHTNILPINHLTHTATFMHLLAQARLLTPSMSPSPPHPGASTQMYTCPPTHLSQTPLNTSKYPLHVQSHVHLYILMGMRTLSQTHVLAHSPLLPLTHTYNHPSVYAHSHTYSTDMHTHR